MIIEVMDLFKRYGEFIAINYIDFHVEEGSCFGILGPNGAGKTTIIKSILGLSSFEIGLVKIFGKDIREDAREIRKRVGVCQQEDNLDPDFSVLHNLTNFAMYFEISKEEAKERALKLLDFVKLNPKLNSHIGELSGGMKRRLMIARSLINNPDILILDEPTLGLDPQSRALVWQMLKELKGKHITTILTTHYMEEAYNLCDSLIIVDMGKIVTFGKPSELIDKYIGSNVIEINSLDNEIINYLNDNKINYDRLSDKIIIYKGAGDFAAKFHGAPMVFRNGTLEDVFLKLTGRDIRE